VKPEKTIDRLSAVGISEITFLICAQSDWLPHAEQSTIPLESWNRGVFAMLHTMYQLSVSEAVTKTPSPAITIAK
jgi:hypothetical protein